jgi:hypothetical protein
MSDLHNISSVALFAVLGYFYYVYHLGAIFVLLGVALGVVTWTYPSYQKIDRKLKQAQIELLQAKTEYYKRKPA